MAKRALITGITGQDGYYLGAFLLKKGYEVLGIKRRTSQDNSVRLNGLLQDADSGAPALGLEYGDMTDGGNLIRVLRDFKPAEIYNLAAQSDVKVSFETPEYTANCDALGTLRMLEAIRILGAERTVRLYQASTSELYGLAPEAPQKETTAFHPCSPYAVAKLYAYWIVRNYREAYGLFASNGILFNHESPLRGEQFVTRKVSRAVARIKLQMQNTLVLGNLNAQRDWGFAGDYVQAMWLILQHREPDDFVIATGENHSIRELVDYAFKEVGISLVWQGEGLNEKGVDSESGKTLVTIDPRYFRPTDAPALLGNASKAREILGWEPKVGFKELVKLMVAADLREAEKELLSADAGLD